MLAILVFILVFTLCYYCMWRGLSVLHSDRQSSYTAYRVNIIGAAGNRNEQTGKDKVVQQVVEYRKLYPCSTTSCQYGFLVSQGYQTVLQCRTSLGWTFRGSAYCQLIRDANNKVKWLEWARNIGSYSDEAFHNVIFTDECTVQLETHRRFCCRKRGEPPTRKPR